MPPEDASRTRLVTQDGRVLLIPKVASTSLRKRFGPCIDVDAEPWRGGRILVFVRDPMARLQSAFRTFFMDEDFDHFTRRSVARGPDSLWRAFVDAVLAGHGNGHWRRQSDFALGLNAELVPFERLTRRLGPLPRLRVSGGFEASGYRTRELEEHYTLDYRLRRRAWAPHN